MAMTARRLSIGEFSKLCRLTVVTLRHYDRVGLLPPAEIDATTGYRYYHFDQVDTALRIGLLRSLDVSIADLHHIVTGSASLDDVLTAHRSRLTAQIDERRRMLEVVDALVHSVGAQQYDIVRALEPQQCVLALAFDTAWVRVASATRHRMTRLAVALRRDGIAPGARTGALFPVTPNERVTVTVFAGMADDDAGLARFADRIERNERSPAPLILPSVDAISTTHRGDHRVLGYAYHALLARIAALGLDAVGPAREHYLASDAGVAVTRLVIPVSGAPGSAPPALRPE